MKCPQCGNSMLIVENVGDGKVKRSCSKCGWSNIFESDGRKLLTEVPPADRRRLLTEMT